MVNAIIISQYCVNRMSIIMLPFSVFKLFWSDKEITGSKPDYVFVLKGSHSNKFKHLSLS